MGVVDHAEFDNHESLHYLHDTNELEYRKYRVNCRHVARHTHGSTAHTYRDQLDGLRRLRAPRRRQSPLRGHRPNGELPVRRAGPRDDAGWYRRARCYRRY